jgi:UDP-N-acetylglucosamine 2-epimerase (non-hydrolysing)
MTKLASSVVFTSQGIPFFLGGEEMCRTKPLANGKLDSNSYKSPDSTNSVKWDTLSSSLVSGVSNYYKGLIEFRKAHPSLRLTTTEDVNNSIKFSEDVGDNVVAYEVSGKPNGEKADSIFVAYNANKEDVQVKLPKSDKWQVCVNGEKAGTDVIETINGDTVTVKAQSTMVLVLGDTNSCLSVIGAKRLHIPIFHMEAGNRCKDENLPEETNRRIVDIISDVNLAYSEHARRYLAECGLPKERTYVTGSPMAEVLHNNLEEIEASDIHNRLGLEKGKYILLSAHREENIDSEKNFTSLFRAINAMAEKYDMPVLYSCHPRSRKRLAANGFQLDKRVIQHEPLGFHDYNCLQMNAFAVVSDSGTLPEESSFFTSVGHSFPAICIRTSTERPEALDKACFILAGIDEKSLLQAVDTAVEMNKNQDNGIPVPNYVDENVSTKTVKLIQSYTGVVNKMIWRK